MRHRIPPRTVLPALGIAIGITTMIVVTGIAASGRQALSEQLAALGTNILRAQAVADSTPPPRSRRCPNPRPRWPRG